MRARQCLLLLIVASCAMLPALCGTPNPPNPPPTSVPGTDCQPVAGVVMTDIYAITPGQINLGPAYGDLAGAVSAQIFGQNPDGSYQVQHYWISSQGDIIKFHWASLYAVALPGLPGVFAVPWGYYTAYIVPGGTGKWAKANGYITTFGMADFNALTLVLRYRGQVCFNFAGLPSDD